MSRIAKAVLAREWGRPVVVEEIEVESPHADEVMIEIAACGVCHSDLSAANGTIPHPPPIVLGHEAAGIVVEVGDGVTEYAIGDRVISSFVTMCGRCRYCTTGRPALCDEAAKAYYTLPDGTLRTRDRAGEPLNVFQACGVMAEYATLHVNNVVPLTDEVPLDRAALVGCAVMTGVGAVFNTARLEAGATAVVVGCGGVGLNVVQGAAIAGASAIVAVDNTPNKLEMAREFGATATVLAGEDPREVVKQVKALTDGGADYAFECIGRGDTVELAYRCAGKGGMTVVIGVADPKDRTGFSTLSLTSLEKTICGSWWGTARPRRDFPRLLSLYRAGVLKLDELITRTYTIDEAAAAFEDLEAGKNARGVIVFG